ncbi:uncharacterized protein N7483_004425 [Penicillium malachiteum]|uniref:uncharacterized protein n=1 Tax=Penicillium malachiteum TaxID=1324776 RepID=UPI002546A34D|nr:uncharacterized protein N7483_004425 [Penicillium malachiteum]KAJ5729917.1 hypothetical protein N7483_004425 [Penicillium malachiteum]
MVRFVDLEGDAFTEHPGATFSLEKPFPPRLMVAPIASMAAASNDFPSSPTSPDDERDIQNKPSSSATNADTVQNPDNPNRNAFSAALNCYPVVKEIARAVDLNTLHALSRTCRQFHVNLAQFRHQLVRETLRCENEYIETVTDMLDGGAMISNNVKSILRILSQESSESGRMTRGKVGRCARDMVGECRRCGKVVCRNCTIKPPSQTAMKARIRRLCRTCNTAPLSRHLLLVENPSICTESTSKAEKDLCSKGFKAAALAQSICNCSDALWLCVQCGQTLRSNDTTYRRVWAWRTRYSTYLGGGLGTGIGEGCQGVKCGRGEGCLAAQEIELEVDCEADEGSSGTSSPGYYSPGSHPSVPVSASSVYHQELVASDGHDDEEPGYFRQEVIGLGGVVKHKSKKRVMVGACVVEYEDERETGKYLLREECGSHRSWCGWCSRVIPADREI